MSARLPAIALACAALAAGCRVYDADGYPENVTQPWTGAKALTWDDEYHEVSARVILSFPDGHRAAWYAVDLPDGATELEVEAKTALSAPRVQLGLEIIDASGNRVAYGRSRRRVRNHTDGLSPGRYLIHVFVYERGAAARVRLIARHEPAYRPVPPPGCVFPEPVPPQAVSPFRPGPEPVIPCIEQLPALP